MKTQKLIIICLLIFVLACKKESDRSSRCNITSIIQTATGGNQAFTIAYNEGRIATIDQTVSPATHKDFSYDGNTMYVVSLDKDGHFAQKDSITLDSKQRPVNIRSFLDIDQNYWYNYTFEYNGDELKKMVQVSQAGTDLGTTTFTYSNGNPIVFSAGNVSSIIDYYTDKKVQKGDYLEMASLIQFGVSLYPHKNLVKTIATGGTIVNISYEFKSDGLISKVTLNSGTGVGLLSYGYECQ